MYFLLIAICIEGIIWPKAIMSSHVESPVDPDTNPVVKQWDTAIDSQRQNRVTEVNIKSRDSILNSRVLRAKNVRS